MEKIRSDLLRRILAGNRQRLNSEFAFARQNNLHLDESVFSGYLVKFLDPLADKLESAGYEKLEGMVLSLYRKILELLTKNILGSGRYPGMDELILSICNGYPRLILSDADTIVSSAVNALMKLYRLSPGKARLWEEKMRRIAAGINDAGSFMDLGLAAAWTCGLAPYREKALEVLEGASREEAAGILEIDGEIPPPIAEMKKNPWFDPRAPGEDPVVIRNISGFTGFGGEFLRPPEVFCSDGGIIAGDGKQYFALHADNYGEMLVPVSGLPVEENEKGEKGGFVKDGVLVAGGKKISLPERCRIPVRSQASSGPTLCFTSHQSFRVFIVGIAR